MPGAPSGASSSSASSSGRAAHCPTARRTAVTRMPLPLAMQPALRRRSGRCLARTTTNTTWCVTASRSTLRARCPRWRCTCRRTWRWHSRRRAAAAPATPPCLPDPSPAPGPIQVGAGRYCLQVGACWVCLPAWRLPRWRCSRGLQGSLGTRHTPAVRALFKHCKLWRAASSAALAPWCQQHSPTALVVSVIKRSSWHRLPPAGFLPVLTGCLGA